jgi:energy-coupling factor transporter ATP-binding protein EcfA2
MISIPQQVKTIHSHYDYAMIWKFIHAKGIEIYGPKFILHEKDGPIITKLMVYFLQDKTLAKQLEIDLYKGIMLTGPVGCGKTSLLNLMRHLLPAECRYAIKPCREIAMAYSQDGYEVIQRYTRLSFNPYTQAPLTVCFDDLGLESPVQYFGNLCNTMAEILLSRYDHFTHQKMLTHITTNLSAQEIQDRYGLRIRSRCRELFNLIAFNNNSADKRKK